MVKEVEINGRKYFECEICKMDYKEKELAEKCQNWCSSHDSCNSEVIKLSVGVMGQLLSESDKNS